MVIRVATCDQRPPRGVGTVGRKLPVTRAVGVGIRRGIGVATYADLVRHRFDGVGHGQQDIFEIGLEPRAAQVEHRPVVGIGDLDAQTFLGDLEQDLILELDQLRVLVDFVLQLLQQQLEALLFNGLIVFAGVVLSVVLLAIRLGR